MTLSWRQKLLLCGASAAVLGVVSYAYYQSVQKKKQGKDTLVKKEEGSKTGSGETKKSVKTVTKKKAKKEAAKVRPPQMDELPMDMQQMLAACDLTVGQIAELPADVKQKVFYALLMKGEMHMNTPGQIEAALECFAKSVVIVPNPAEVIGALEKTLPPQIFTALLDRVQGDIKAKIGDYYKELPPKDANLKFLEVGQASGEEMSSWSPVAIRDAAVGNTLWLERADSAALTIAAENPLEYCEHCLKKLDKEIVACEACGSKLYCSKQCCIKSSEIYHALICKPGPQVEDALAKLYALCRENQSSLALLMLRYIAFLLSEELRGNGVARNGPFAHYDHLRPVFRAPNDVDRAEVKLIRSIFTPINDQVVEFLSDEIYTSMKATLAHHVFAVSLDDTKDMEKPPVALSRVESRQVGSVAEALAFFPISAHLPHSCDPNSVLVCNDAIKSIRVAALRNVKTGDKLTLSYLPFASGTGKAERQLHLMRVFGFECKCDICEADLPCH